MTQCRQMFKHVFHLSWSRGGMLWWVGIQALLSTHWLSVLILLLTHSINVSSQSVISKSQVFICLFVCFNLKDVTF